MFPVELGPAGDAFPPCPEHPFPAEPFLPLPRIAFPPSPLGEMFKYIPFLILIWSK